MLVDDIGDVTITNDGATILKMLEVEHPAAKVGLNPRFFCCCSHALALYVSIQSLDCFDTLLLLGVACILHVKWGYAHLSILMDLLVHIKGLFGFIYLLALPSFVANRYLLNWLNFRTEKLEMGQLQWLLLLLSCLRYQLTSSLIQYALSKDYYNAV